MQKKERRTKLAYMQERVETEVMAHLNNKTFKSTGIHPVYILSKGEWAGVEANSIVLEHYSRETCVKKTKLESVEVTSFKVRAIGLNINRAFKGHSKKTPLRLGEILNWYSFDEGVGKVQGIRWCQWNT